MHKLLILFWISPLILTSSLQACPDSYFFDSQHCEECELNCICSSYMGCDECIQGYTMYDGSCIRCPQASGIYGTCSGCCSRTTGTILACTDCSSVSNTYSFLFSGRCIVSDGCFEVDENGFCQSCNSGFFSHDSQCFQCDASCATCSDNDNCITCNDGYYWMVADGGLCSACPTGCATCALTDGQVLCSSCLSAYYLYEDHCLECPANCDVCVDGSTCTSCSQGILVSSLCIECTDTTYGGSTGCLQCEEVNSFIECTQCDDTYFLDADNAVCRQCSDFIVGGERCRDENTPTQCQDDHDPLLTNRYYLVGISCVANTKNCRKIADIEGNCSMCYDGYTITSSECIQCAYTGCQPASTSVVGNTCVCSECLQGYYLSGDDCVPCSELNCARCESDSCTACVSGFFWDGSACSGSSASNCAEAGSASICNVCDDGYWLGSDQMCYECQSNCLLCSERFVCTQCSDGYHLMSGQCIQYPDNCVKIETPAESSLTCTLCEHGHYLVNGYCKECSVEKGTLSQCQGLCPIDYYIESLLPETTKYEGYMVVVLVFMLLFSVL